MTQPKILIFTTTKSGTGVARFNEHIADAILRAGWTAILAQPEEPDYRGRMADCSAAERHFFRRDPYADIVGFGADRFLPAILFGETRPDLVVFSSGIHPLTTVAGMQAAHFFRIPYVTVDGLVAPSLYDWDENALTMVSRLYGNAEAVIVKSQESLGALRQCLRLPADVGSVIVSGRPDRYFEPRDETRRAALRRQLQIPDDSILCLTAAKLEIVKGHALQIDAMQQLKARPVWDRLHFAWAGEGEERERLETALAVAGVSDRVHLLGHRTDISAWMDAADCFVLTSHSEGIPLSMLEAMAKGLPVIATAIGGVPEALDDTGILVPRPAMYDECIEGLVAALVRLATDDAGRRDMGVACRVRAAAYYRLDRMTDAYLAVFDEAMSGQSETNV